MSNRKLIRPEAEPRKDGVRGGSRRKSSPPEQTGAEEYYYLKQMGAKTPMVVVLDDGEELTGIIEWYDKDAIKLNRERDPNLMILKRCIRYMFKEAERKRGRRKA